MSLFTALCRLYHVFEFIQSRWIADGNPLRLGSERDPLVGQSRQNGAMVIPGRPPSFLSGIPSFVTTLGGGYYLLPGAAAITAIAEGSC